MIIIEITSIVLIISALNTIPKKKKKKNFPYKIRVQQSKKEEKRHAISSKVFHVIHTKETFLRGNLRRCYITGISRKYCAAVLLKILRQATRPLLVSGTRIAHPFVARRQQPLLNY